MCQSACGSGRGPWVLSNVVSASAGQCAESQQLARFSALVEVERLADQTADMRYAFLDPDEVDDNDSDGSSQRPTYGSSPEAFYTVHYISHAPRFENTAPC